MPKSPAPSPTTQGKLTTDKDPPSLKLTGIIDGGADKLALIAKGNTTYSVAVGDMCEGRPLQEIGANYVILGGDRLELAGY